MAKVDGATVDQVRDASLLTMRYDRLSLVVQVDLCDNCGTMYAFKAADGNG